jgi:DNA adenine methylase
MERKTNKAFLKWAGGKTQSLDFLLSYMRNDFQSPKRFMEPFVGSGIVFSNIDAGKYVINDVNSDLINIYKLLKEDKEPFIAESKALFLKNNDEENYYRLREEFNNSKDSFVRSTIFLYLNRHCFNGLCRYNKSGRFNVPFGKYKSVHFPEKELRAYSKRLINAEILCGDFEEVFKLATPEDIIYCDPPYLPISKTSDFTDYNTGGFSLENQLRLVKFAEQAPCRVLISNHDTEMSRELYKKAKVIKTKQINRFISAKATSRKKVCELLAIY